MKAWQGTAHGTEACSGTSSTVCLNDQGGNRMDVTKDITCTLRATSNHPPLVFENHAQDSRYTGPLAVAQTVLSTFGTGGNNQPFVVEDAQCFDVRFTSEGTKNVRANSYQTEIARTIDTGGNSPDSNQGGVAVVAIQGSMIGRKEENGPLGDGVSEDTCYTLNTVDRHGVVYAIDRESFNCGENFARKLGIDRKSVV